MEYILWILATVISLAIAHFYYRLSGKSLSFYLLFDDEPLSRVDPAVRDRLSIAFSYPEAPDNPGELGQKNPIASPITNLHHIQVIIFNSGIKAITFNESPIIEIPSCGTILDASLIYQKPSDLEANIARLPAEEGKDQKVIVATKMLNKGDLIVIKFLFSEAIDSGKLKLHLLAEDLPRNILIKPIPREATKSRWEAADVAAIVVGAICGLLGAAMVTLASHAWHTDPPPSIDKLGLLGFIEHLSFINYMCIVSFIGSVLLGFVGAAIGYGFGVHPLFQRNRVVLPVDLRPPGQ